MPTNHPLHQPSSPSPTDGPVNQGIDINLGWIAGDPDGDSLSYDVYLETNDSTPDVLLWDNARSSTCGPGTLDYSTHRYWRIVARDEHGLTSGGPAWDFVTGTCSNQPPYVPSNPLPPDGVTGQGVDVDLTWTGGDPDGDSVMYDLYLELGNLAPATLVCDDAATSSCDPDTLYDPAPYYGQPLPQVPSRL